MSNGEDTPTPPGWCKAAVGELGQVRLGRQRSPKNRSGRYPTKYIRAANLTWTGLDLSDVLDMDFKPQELETYRLRPGDVVLSEASGSQGEVGKPAIWRGEIENCCFQNTVIRFRPDVVESAYAHLIFCHFARNKVFAQIAPGVGIHHLGADRFARIQFPVPPTSEQRRIVAKADELFSKLDAGVAALQRVQENFKRYRASVLKAAVEGRLTAQWRAENPSVEPAEVLLERILQERYRKWEEEQLRNYEVQGKKPPKDWKEKYAGPLMPDTAGLPELPRGWVWATIDQLVSRSEYGTSVKCGYEATGSPVLRIPNIAGGRLDTADIKFATKDLSLDEDTALSPGDLLMCRTNGSIGLVGKSALVDRTLSPPHGFASYLLRFRFVEQATASAWVHWYVTSHLGRVFIESNAASSAGQHNISLSLMHRMIVPLPPAAEQSQILSTIETHTTSSDRLQALVQADVMRSERLRQSILKRAFEGSLVPQDPTDEPAIVLLERIRKQREAGSNGAGRRSSHAQAKNASRWPCKKKDTDDAGLRQLEFPTAAKPTRRTP